MRLPIESMRTAAEALMVDTVVVDRLTGEGDYDYDTGAMSADTWAEVYSGVGSVFAAAEPGSEEDDGEAMFTRKLYRLRVPWNAAIEPDDRVRVTVSASGSPELDEVEFRVRTVPTSSTPITRRAVLERFDQQDHTVRGSTS